MYLIPFLVVANAFEVFLQALSTNLLDAPIVDKIISKILFACSSENESLSSSRYGIHIFSNSFCLSSKLEMSLLCKVESLS